MGRLTYRTNRGGPSGPGGPFYALPGPGEIDIISTSWLTNALAPHSGNYPGAFDWAYSLFNSYGVGVFVEDYSAGGAFVWAGCGGHNHPDITGAIVVDFTDLTADYLPHTNSGPQFSSYTGTYGFRDAEETGAPWREVVDSVNGDEAVPRPGHPYQQLAVMPSAIGGGTKGSVIYVGRSGIGENGDVSSQRVHRFDLNTARWSRITTATLARADYESSVVYDAARGFYWHVSAGGNHSQANYQTVEYLDAADWTVKYTSTFDWPPSGVGNNGSRAFLHGSVLIVQGDGGQLYGFDPASASSGFVTLTMSGSNSGSDLDRPVYYPRTGKYYKVGQDGGSTLVRITPPANPITGTWACDTVSVDQSLPAVTRAGDGANLASSHYGLLFYVPSIDRLAWIPDGSTICLLDPT